MHIFVRMKQLMQHFAECKINMFICLREIFLPHGLWDPDQGLNPGPGCESTES